MTADKMATKTKLAQAVKEQAGQLDGAQCGFVMAEYRTWEWNDRRIKEIEGVLTMDSKARDPMDSSDRKQLMTERHQLVTESASLFSHIMRHLKDTGTEEADELDKFMRG